MVATQMGVAVMMVMGSSGEPLVAVGIMGSSVDGAGRGSDLL